MCDDILQISLRIKNLSPRESCWESKIIWNNNKVYCAIKRVSINIQSSYSYCFVVRQVSVCTVALVNQSVKKMRTFIKWISKFRRSLGKLQLTSMSTRSRVKTLMMNIMYELSTTVQHLNIYSLNNLSIYNNSRLSLKNYSVSQTLSQI